MEVSTSLEVCEFVVFPDGCRRFRDGHEASGPPPADAAERWLAAPHQPDWACRMVLSIAAVRRQRLSAMTRAELRAEGLRPLLGLTAWRWPRPLSRLHWSARAAFARLWDATHPAEGLRWRNDPEVAVLEFVVERR